VGGPGFGASLAGMGTPKALVDLFVTTDSLLGAVRTTWWGAVVTDARYPAIHDVNYARVEASQPDLLLAEVREAMLPALREAGATHEHVVLFDPTDMDPFLEDLGAQGDRIGWDTAMEFVGPPPDGVSEANPVEEIHADDPDFWAAQRRAFHEFDVTEGAALDQILGWERDVLVPFGKRWFGVRIDDAFAGFGALLPHGEAGYVDNVVTLPEARRRGVAGSIVLRIVAEARAEGAERVFLLADQPGPIRLYERLGFRECGRIASSLRPLRH
jgi:ribosomal protein S18 acetylase RimI-like enzyme